MVRRMKGRVKLTDRIGKTQVENNLDPLHVLIRCAEGQNLTVRMHMRRFTWLTTTFSKKVGKSRLRRYSSYGVLQLR